MASRPVVGRDNRERLYGRLHEYPANRRLAPIELAPRERPPRRRRERPQFAGRECGGVAGADRPVEEQTDALDPSCPELRSAESSVGSNLCKLRNSAGVALEAQVFRRRRQRAEPPL